MKVLISNTDSGLLKPGKNFMLLLLLSGLG